MNAPHLDAETVARLVRDAVTAPSMHNAQPWRFVFHAGSGVIGLYGDPGRAMPRTDPSSRALHLGCAAALFNLRVAIAHMGYGATVHLLPDGRDPWLLAEVALDAQTPHERDLAALHGALRRRHTSRHPFTDEPVPTSLMDGLRAAARLEGCLLTTPGPWHVETLRELVRDAEHNEEDDPLARAETVAWTRPPLPPPPAGRCRDGIPATAFGQHSAAGPGLVRDFGRARPMADREWATFEERPQLALLATPADGRTDWLRAGQALQRVLLQATVDGLATSMISHPLEWPALRPMARDPLQRMGRVHMILRFGYGPPGPGTPRRPVAQVLDIR